MLINKPKTKILVDGGDPAETLQMKDLIGFVDGQTTNPSLIAKNPEIRGLIESGKKLTLHEEENEYRKIVRIISTLVGDAWGFDRGVCGPGYPAEDMLAQGEQTCPPGFQMLTLNIHVRIKDCELQNCQSKKILE